MHADLLAVLDRAAQGEPVAANHAGFRFWWFDKGDGPWEPNGQLAYDVFCEALKKAKV
jgi:hypothetical protein